MATRDRLVIRAPEPADEGWVRAAHAELATEGFDFALGLADAPTFADWVEACARQVRGLDLPSGWVPNTFLVALLDGDGSPACRCATN